MREATPPPPIRSNPRKRRNLATLLVIIFVVAAVITGGLYLTIHQIIASGITKGPDAMFGDQNLKTSVALIELHKVRFGRYPAKLSDLKFTGDWDQIALQSVSYYPNADGTAYYLEVERGWIGKPALKMPDEFWRGTGYNPSLKPVKP
jgi:hypothetical protein